MAMEPMLLVCQSCGVRIRTRDPEKARTRACPRCSEPLASALEKVIGVATPPTPSEPQRIVAPPEELAWREVPRRSGRQRVLGVVALLATLAWLATLAFRDPSPGVVAPRPERAKTSPRSAEVDSKLSHVLADSRLEAEDPADPVEAGPAGPVPDLTPPPPHPRSADLAIRDHERGDPLTSLGPLLPPRSGRNLADSPPPPPQPDSTPDPAAPVASRKLLVRDSRGRAIVAREYGMLKERMAVVLPDGQIGWPDGLVYTDRPFVPETVEGLRESLLLDPELATFKVLQTDHYLVYHQGSKAFASASAELLEKLYDGLDETLKKYTIPVNRLEFPLVAVIFATEEEFRGKRKVSPDVQAYYDILSNRIYFYEKSRRDQESPEVSALRKPQTVAHEGTHQILHNIGIQPRLSPWPLWLVEGFAEYCSPPKTTRKGVDWAGLGQVNPLHMATMRDLDDPLSTVVKGGPGDALIGRDRKTPLVEYLVTRNELTPTDYALSWALTHYLFTQRTEDFVAYMKRMSQLKPFEERTSRQQLDDFREVFGHDLAKMDGKVAKYLKGIKLPESLTLPYFAVLFEQRVGQGAMRRMAMVSQSPSMIRQWVESNVSPNGGPSQWQVVRGPTRVRAVIAADQWMMQGH